MPRPTLDAKPASMKILVTGASGLLGRAVLRQLENDGSDVVGTALTRATLNPKLVKIDLTDSQQLDSFLEEQSPSIIIHTAAERRPDVVQSNPEASEALNVQVPSHLAAWSKGRGKDGPLVINISTDYVFDGVRPPFTVNDSPNPLNAYGKSKWEGEKGLLLHGESGKVCNLRVPVLYGSTVTNDESAVNILLNAVLPSKDGSPLPQRKMDANAVRYPTNTSDVAKALSQLCNVFLVQQSLPPTLHFSAMEAMTKYDMCNVLARSLRALGETAEAEHLVPEYEIDPSAATTRPRHCKLDVSLIKELGVDVDCVSFEHWWHDYLHEYVQQVRVLRQKEEEERKKKQQEDERQKEQEEEEQRKQQEEEKRKREDAEKQKVVEQERERERIQRMEEAERIKEDKDSKANEVREQHPDSASAHNDGEIQGASSHESSVVSVEQKGQRTSFDNGEDASINSAGVSRTFPTSHGSLRSPSSPNPSFSSLQARPTPPATSGLNSPTSSNFSTGHTIPIPHAASRDGDNTTQDDIGSEATNLATSVNTAIAESERQSTDPLLEVDRKGDGKTVTEPANLQRKSTSVAAAHTHLQVSTDMDSDGYGQPSPQENTPFAPGYGEVPYGFTEQEEEQSKPSESFQTSPDIRPPRFSIRVGDPQKVGDPVTAHIVYTVRIKTNSTRFKATQFSVLRRYSDFRWLHAALVHNNPGIFVPPVPEKVKIGRFAPDLVEARRHGLERCINKIANNVSLQEDDDFHIFLESQNFHLDVKARDQVKGPVPTPEQKTYFGWSSSFTGQSHRYHETDEWFDEQNVHLDHLELQLKTLVRVLSALSQQRKDIALATSDYSHALMMLSGSSLSRSLSTCFAGLGEVERRTFELADIQADADVRDYGSVIYEFERMVGSARKAFSTRIDAWQLWQRLEDEARKVRSKRDKLKRETQQGNSRASDGRLRLALDEMADIESRCLQAKTEFDLIGRRCKEEMDRFEWDHIQTLQEACEIWLQGMIERSHEVRDSLLI